MTTLDVLQGLSGPAIDMKDPVIALLFSLVAASAHIIVPAAVFNLKVLSHTQHNMNLQLTADCGMALSGAQTDECVALDRRHAGSHVCYVECPAAGEIQWQSQVNH